MEDVHARQSAACPDCGGTGVITLFTSMRPCERCKPAMIEATFTDCTFLAEIRDEDIREVSLAMLRKMGVAHQTLDDRTRIVADEVPADPPKYVPTSEVVFPSCTPYKLCSIEATIGDKVYTWKFDQPKCEPTRVGNYSGVRYSLTPVR